MTDEQIELLIDTVGNEVAELLGSIPEKLAHVITLLDLSLI